MKTINHNLSRAGSKNGMYGSHRVGTANPFYGRVHSLETKRKISEAKKGNVPGLKGKPSPYRGEKHWNWKGGISVANEKLRQSIEYREWRTTVFERDGYTCVLCGDATSGNLQADHIKPFSLYPELRFNVDNGRTLCRACHRQHGWNLFRVNNPRKAVG